MYAKRKDSQTFKVLISFVQNNEFSIFLCYWAKEHGYTSLDLLELPTSHLWNPYISLSFKKKTQKLHSIEEFFFYAHLCTAHGDQCEINLVTAAASEWYDAVGSPKDAW